MNAAALFRKSEEDNYKLFFPLAVPGFFLGIGLWIVSDNYAYSRLWHPPLLMHLFLFPAALGFLWTGIPRFLASEFPSGIWKSAYVILILISYLAFFLNDIRLFTAAAFLSNAGLILWYVILIRKSRSSPVVVGPFLFYAILSAAVGSALQAYSHITSISFSVIQAGNEMYRFTFFLFLLGAVGSRLLPAMFRSHPPKKKNLSVWNLSFSRKPSFWWIFGAVVWIGITSASFFPGEILVSLKLLVLIFFGKEIWLLFQPYENRIMTVWYLRVGMYALVVSPAVYLLPQIFPPAAAHFQFISMFVLLIFIVSARVIFGHGGYNVEEKEGRSVSLAVSYFLILCVLLVRPISNFLPEREFTHSVLALLLTASGILFLLEIVRTVTEEKIKKPE